MRRVPQGRSESGLRKAQCRLDLVDESVFEGEDDGLDAVAEFQF